MGKCVLCTLEISEEDSRHAMGTVPAQGLLCVGWTGRLTQRGARVTECLIHMVQKPHFFSLSFPQRHFSRGIRGAVGHYEVLHVPYVTLWLNPHSWVSFVSLGSSVRIRDAIRVFEEAHFSSVPLNYSGVICSFLSPGDRRLLPYTSFSNSASVSLVCVVGANKGLACKSHLSPSSISNDSDPNLLPGNIQARV